MPIPPEKIIEIAKGSGFDTELRVAAIAKRGGLSVSQSVYYTDKDERKGRELDLQLYTSAMDKTSDPVIRCVVMLSVEVKKTREPFIFFTSERGSVERGEAFATINWLHNVDSSLLSPAAIENQRPHSRPARLARTYTGAKGNGGQQIQSGILSAIKAALHYQGKSLEHWDESSRDAVFFVPILVVDGPLCECYLDKSGRLQASEVDEVVYLQNYLSDNYGDIGAQIAIMTVDRFEQIADHYEEWAKSVVAALVATRHRTPTRNLHANVVPPTTSFS